MKIVFMGTPDFAVSSLAALAGAGHEIAGVVTGPDKPSGRRMELKPSPVKKEALERGFDIYQPEKIRNNPDFRKLLEKISPDIIVVAAYGKIIPSDILKLPKYGCVNVHASLLPRYRGAAPIQWAVINGDRESGVTIMQMDEGLDTGDMLSRRKVALSPDETGGSLFEKLAGVGADLLVDTLAEIESGKTVPEKQPAESPTPYARMIRKEDGLIDWNLSSSALERLVRGLDPWPGTFTYLGGKMLKIWKVSVISKDAEESHDHAVTRFGLSETDGAVSGAASEIPPGTVTGVSDDGIRVKTGTGELLMTEVQIAGKKRMSAADFLRGHSLTAGMILGR